MGADKCELYVPFQHSQRCHMSSCWKCCPQLAVSAPGWRRSPPLAPSPRANSDHIASVLALSAWSTDDGTWNSVLPREYKGEPSSRDGSWLPPWVSIGASPALALRCNARHCHQCEVQTWHDLPSPAGPGQLPASWWCAWRGRTHSASQRACSHSVA